MDLQALLLIVTIELRSTAVTTMVQFQRKSVSHLDLSIGETVTKKISFTHTHTQNDMAGIPSRQEQLTKSSFYKIPEVKGV